MLFSLMKWPGFSDIARSQRHRHASGQGQTPLHHLPRDCTHGKFFYFKRRLREKKGESGTNVALLLSLVASWSGA
jgi:hypothetical protein